MALSAIEVLAVVLAIAYLLLDLKHQSLTGGLKLKGAVDAR